MTAGELLAPVVYWPAIEPTGVRPRVDSADRDRFDALVRLRFPALLRFGYVLTRDWQLAEDLTQTALAKTWFRWGQLRDVDAAEFYVRRLMVSANSKWWRRKWRGEVPTEFLPERASTAAYDAADRTVTRDALTRALLTLPPKTRAMLALRFYDDLSEVEVADIVGCSVGNVKSTVSRALARLRADGLLDDLRPSRGGELA
jgi:RNA polymerase sigma-70 factor (sigma-E family)